MQNCTHFEQTKSAGHFLYHILQLENFTVTYLECHCMWDYLQRYFVQITKLTVLCRFLSSLQHPAQRIHESMTSILALCWNPQYWKLYISMSSIAKSNLVYIEMFRQTVQFNPCFNIVKHTTNGRVLFSAQDFILCLFIDSKLSKESPELSMRM